MPYVFYYLKYLPKSPCSRPCYHTYIGHKSAELEMRQWWKEKDYLDFENEFLIRNDTSQEDLINMILKTMSIK